MSDIKTMVQQVVLHDAMIDSVMMYGKGTVEIRLELDDVWNGSSASDIVGLRFPSVYEMAECKLDCLNVIGELSITPLADYHSEGSVGHDSDGSNPLSVVFELVAGGRIVLIGTGEAEWIRATT